MNADGTTSADEGEDKTDDAVEVFWQRALASWNDDKVHAALIEYAMRTENLPNVAGKYRALKDDAEKGARAKKQLDAIVVAATQMMLAQKTARPERGKPPPWLTVVTAAVCVALLVYLAMAILRRR